MKNNSKCDLSQVISLVGDTESFMSALSEPVTNAPFSEILKSFVCSFSRDLLSDPVAKSYPDLVALGFWMRKANITKLESAFYQSGDTKVPVGSVLHFAPSNVDTIFIYSLFLSLLVGNANIVRVSSKSSPQKDLLIRLLDELLNKEEFRVLKNSLSIVTYPHIEDINEYLCASVDKRVIWGGDDTVSKISSYQMKPTATEIKFANKYSLSLINAAALKEVSEHEYNTLINNFVNDTYWFGQLGCSSPRTVLWLNAESHQDPINEFWTAVNGHALKMFDDSVSNADVINKIVASNMVAVELDNTRVTQYGKMLTSIKLPNVDSHNDIRSLHCGAGLFLEANLDELEVLAHLVDRKTQTISYWGMDASTLKSDLLSLQIYPDRVLPIGKSLEFSIKWDGFDLLNSLSRVIDFS